MTTSVAIGLGLAGGAVLVAGAVGAALGDVPLPNPGLVDTISKAVTAGVLVYLAKGRAKEAQKARNQETSSNPSLNTFPPRSENSERLVELVEDVKGLVESFQEHRGEFREHRADTKARLRMVEGRLGINNPQTGELPRPGARS